MNSSEEAFLELITRKTRDGDTRLTTKYAPWRNGVHQIPPEIGSATQLTDLMIVGNGISHLPPEIGELTNLKYLTLYTDNLKSLPKEIGKLTHLEHLTVSRSQLVELPPEIGNLASLRTLQASSASIVRIPPEIGDLENLSDLQLFTNLLDYLPEEIARLPHLYSLSLGANLFTEVPDCILGLGIYVLEIGGKLSEFPAPLSQMPNLSELHLWKNQIPEIPSEIKHFTSLRRLDLLDNRVVNISPDIGQLSELSHLELGNNLVINLPKEIANLPLTYLGLSGNPIRNVPPGLLSKGSRTLLAYLQEWKEHGDRAANLKYWTSEAYLNLEKDFGSDFERDDLAKPWKGARQAGITKQELLAAIGDTTKSSEELYEALDSAQGLDLSEGELIPALIGSQHVLPNLFAFNKLHRLLFCSLQRTGAEMVLSDEYLHHHNPFVAVFHADLVRRYRYYLIRKGKLDAKAYCDTLEEEKNLEWALGLRRPELVELLEKPGVSTEEQQALLQALFHPKYEIGRYDGITQIYRTRVDPEDNWSTLEAGLAGVLARLLHSEKRDKYGEPFWHDVGYYTRELDSDSLYFVRALVRALLGAEGDRQTVGAIADMLRTVRSAEIRRELIEGLSRTESEGAAARLAAYCESQEEWESGELEYTLSALGEMGSVGEAELRKLVHGGRENLREKASEELQRLGIDERPMNVRVETVQFDSLASLLENGMRWLTESGKEHLFGTVAQQPPIRVYLTTLFNWDAPYYKQLLVLLGDGIFQYQVFLVDGNIRYANDVTTQFDQKSVFFLSWEYPVPMPRCLFGRVKEGTEFFRSAEYRDLFKGRSYVKSLRTAGLGSPSEDSYWESESLLDEFIQVCRPLIEKAPCKTVEQWIEEIGLDFSDDSDEYAF